MKQIAPQLHIVLGSIAAMLVAFLALMNGTSPSTCMMKATAAFVVFTGFGLILRYALLDTLTESAEESNSPLSSGLSAMSPGLDVIIPGTSVADLLANHPVGAEESEEQAA